MSKTASCQELAIHPDLAALPLIRDVDAWAMKRARNKDAGGQRREFQKDGMEHGGSSARFQNLIKTNGILRPLGVVPAKNKGKVKWHIIAGRNRFVEGSEAGIDEFPIEIIPAKSVPNFLIAEEAGCKSIPLAAKIYNILRLNPHLLEKKPGARNDLKQPQVSDARLHDLKQPPVSDGRLQTPADLAQLLSCHEETVRGIAKFINWLDDQTPSKARECVCALYAGKGARGIMAGQAGVKATHDGEPTGGGDFREEAVTSWREYFRCEKKQFAKEAAVLDQVTDPEFLKALDEWLALFPPQWRERASNTWQ